MIPFNKPFIARKQIEYLTDVTNSLKWSGDGKYTKMSQDFLEKKYNFSKVLLTTSCTDALEMAAILIDIHEGDEVIVPSYTFVSSANPFLLRGAKIIFADSDENNPNIDVSSLEALITEKTKALVVVHYGGVACDMKSIMNLSKEKGIYIIEDAAQAIDSYYFDKPLGSIGHIGALSFHDTKNITSGEGGAIIINEPGLQSKAEIIREKGTNRSAFYRGEIDKYGWVSIGSSFLISEINAAMLLSQLESIDDVSEQRVQLWNRYYTELKNGQDIGLYSLPSLPAFAKHNGHIFYMICKDLNQRTCLINYLKEKNIFASFHYQSLSESEFAKKNLMYLELPNSKKFTERLVRLPLYFDMTFLDVDIVTSAILDFFKG